MSNSQSRDLAASIRDRLLNIARNNQEDFQSILTRYALERLLYRIYQSQHRDLFILKGAMLFVIWSQEPHRATQDLDLLCYGDNSVTHLEQVFREICTTEVEEDGLDFQSATIRGLTIKEDQTYQGVRIKLNSILIGSKTRIAIQVDIIGFGDSIYLGIQTIEFPTILASFPAPVLQTYQRETVIAEKFQAMVFLGIANSRMKDFYDLWYLSQHFSFNGDVLSQSIKTTFERRKTSLPLAIPIALSSEFFEDASKRKQWQGFLKKGKFKSKCMELRDVILILQSFILPPLQAIAQEQSFNLMWTPSSSWQAIY
jgi:predicted nucleotidyltransferase component of viral defense system